jgi:hypothetical protein
MKKISILVILFVVTLTQTISGQETKNQKNKPAVAQNANDYKLFGDKFALNNVLTNKQMLKKYKTLKKGDSIAVKFQSNIKEVCKKKGCWMQMDLTDNSQSFVRFRDYGFFVPLNADNSEAIVNGYAFIDVVSVDELRHYAKDAGKSADEIKKITKPKVTYSFTASGVYIKK